MDEIRKTLARDTVLAFYDVRKSAIIQADASQSRLMCGLMQQGRPVAFASRALTDAEQNYSQIEKEILAICFACTKFLQYIYGKCTDVQTDHGPLESILRKPIAKASSPRQRMMLQLQCYTLNVMHVPGETDVCGGHAVTRIHSRRAELWSTRQHGSARTQPGREPTSEEFRRVIQRRPSDAVFETVHPTRLAETQTCSPTRDPVILEHT